jgi:hypothetical protein
MSNNALAVGHFTLDLGGPWVLHEVGVHSNALLPRDIKLHKFQYDLEANVAAVCWPCLPRQGYCV